MNHLLARGISIQNGKILLAHYVKKEYWFLPGGHIEPGEAGATALVRECKEEMDIDISSCTYVTTFEHAYEDKEEIQHEITLLYTFETSVDEIHSHIDHLAFKWVPEEEFGTIKFLPKALKENIQKLMEGTKMPSFVSTLEK